jgi:hypothetical protein
MTKGTKRKMIIATKSSDCKSILLSNRRVFNSAKKNTNHPALILVKTGSTKAYYFKEN